MTPDDVAALLNAERERLLVEVEARVRRVRNVTDYPGVGGEATGTAWREFLGWLKGLRGDTSP